VQSLRLKGSVFSNAFTAPSIESLTLLYDIGNLI